MTTTAENIKYWHSFPGDTAGLPISPTLTSLGIFELMLQEYRRKHPDDQDAKVYGLYKPDGFGGFLDKALRLGASTFESLAPQGLSSSPTLRRLIDRLKEAGIIEGAILPFGKEKVPPNRFIPYPQWREAAVAVIPKPKPNPNSEPEIDILYTLGIGWVSLDRISRRTPPLHPLESYQTWGINHRLDYAFDLAIRRMNLVSANNIVTIGSSLWRLT